MSSVVLFILASIGLMSIITTSSIMEPIRTWVHNTYPEKYAQGIECSQCVGFWSGFFASALLETTPYYIAAIIAVIIKLLLVAAFYAIFKEKINKYFYYVLVSTLITTLFQFPKESIHLILYGCAGSAVSIIFVNIISWLDNNNYVDMPE